MEYTTDTSSSEEENVIVRAKIYFEITERPRLLVACFNILSYRRSEQ